MESLINNAWFQGGFAGIALIMFAGVILLGYKLLQAENKTNGEMVKVYAHANKQYAQNFSVLSTAINRLTINDERIGVTLDRVVDLIKNVDEDGQQYSTQIMKNSTSLAKEILHKLDTLKNVIETKAHRDKETAENISKLLDKFERFIQEKYPSV
jgi:hypothetical protein